MAGVQDMWRGDYDRVDGRVVEDRIFISGRMGEAESLLTVFGGSTARRRQRTQFAVRHLGEQRQQRCSCESAATEHAQHALAGCARCTRRGARSRRRFGVALRRWRGRARVLQYNAEMGLLAGHHEAVGVFGLLERKTMRSEGACVQPRLALGTHQVQGGREVLRLGPAHEAGWIGQAALLVVGVVATRP